MSQPATESPSSRMLELKQLCEILVRESGITTGLWELAFEYKVAFGAVSPPGEPPLPSGIVSISKVGVAPATARGPYTIDAAELTKNDLDTSDTARNVGR